MGRTYRMGMEENEHARGILNTKSDGKKGWQTKSRRTDGAVGNGE